MDDVTGFFTGGEEPKKEVFTRDQALRKVLDEAGNILSWAEESAGVLKICKLNGEGETVQHHCVCPTCLTGAAAEIYRCCLELEGLSRLEPTELLEMNGQFWVPVLGGDQ